MAGRFARLDRSRGVRWPSIASLHERFAVPHETSERVVRLGAVPRRSGKSAMLRQHQNAKEQHFTGFELLFLGTGAGAPSVERNATGLCLRMDKSNWMFDCAEGSLRQLMQSTIRVPSTDRFFITHLHGDHIFGLPGMLATIDSLVGGSRDNPIPPRQIAVYGPPGIFSFLNMAFLTSAAQVTNIVITVHELVSSLKPQRAYRAERFPSHQSLRREEIAGESDGNRMIWNVYEDADRHVTAAKLKHSVACFGYVVEENNKVGKLRADVLTRRGLPPGPLYRDLKLGKSVLLPDGSTVRPEEVSDPPTCGRKAVILGDTSSASSLFDIGKDCDVLVHEATLTHEMVEQAVRRGHSTAAMAGYAARRMNAKLLVLTHFSQRFQSDSSLVHPASTRYLELQARQQFHRRAVVAATDFFRVPIARPAPDASDPKKVLGAT